jgi:hypothetical protein
MMYRMLHLDVTACAGTDRTSKRVLFRRVLNGSSPAPRRTIPEFQHVTNESRERVRIYLAGVLWHLLRQMPEVSLTLRKTTEVLNS